MSTLTRAALAADLAAHAFARAGRARRSRRAGSAPRWSSFRSRPRPGGAVRIEGDGVLSPRCRSCAATARGRAGRETLTAKGTPVLHAARRRNAHLRARRPARVQLARRAARRARCSAVLRSVVLPLRAAAAERGDHAARRRHRSRATRSSGAPLLLRTKRYSRMADYLARRGPAGRPDDAADGRIPGGARSRRRAVAPLAGAQRGRAVRGGDLRQLAGVRGSTRPAARAPGRRCWRDARSGADRPALERPRSRSRPTSTSRSSAPAILLADRRRRAPAVRRVARPRTTSRWRSGTTT